MKQARHFCSFLLMKMDTPHAVAENIKKIEEDDLRVKFYKESRSVSEFTDKETDTEMDAGDVEESLRFAIEMELGFLGHFRPALSTAQEEILDSISIDDLMRLDEGWLFDAMKVAGFPRPTDHENEQRRELIKATETQVKKAFRFLGKKFTGNRRSLTTKVRKAAKSHPRQRVINWETVANLRPCPELPKEVLETIRKRLTQLYAAV